MTSNGFKSHRHRHHEGPDSLEAQGLRGLRHVRSAGSGNPAMAVLLRTLRRLIEW